jgi:hypothetical protein
LHPYALVYPSFPFTHAVYFLSDVCGWEKCISRWEHIPQTVFISVFALYVNAFVYFILALYLNEVVP